MKTMKNRFLTTALAITVPFSALALDYTDISSRYADEPFLRPEAAAISLLTRLGAVGGNPDGTFAAERTLNRAEFLKIAMLAGGDVEITSNDAENCFPDVRESDWFSPYVCTAKALDIVRGNPDGKFHPERPVNYAEAIKILAEVFLYDVRVTEPWYKGYVEAAQEQSVLLPINLAYDSPLTRGQMARLAAAFRANAEGELTQYRNAERGVFTSSSSSVSSSSSISSSSSSISSSVSSSSVSSSSSSVVSGLPVFPSRSQFLIAGGRSEPIAGGTFFASLEPMYVQSAEVKLKNKRDSIDAMYIVDSNGVELGTLSLDRTYDTTHKTWRGTFSKFAYKISKDEQRTIGVEIRIKDRNQGGASEETVQVDTFKIFTEGEWSTTGSTGVAQGPFPIHQTSFGRIVSVKNAMETEGLLQLGPSSLLAAFTVEGSALQGVNLAVESLEFSLSSSGDITVTNWQLGTPESGEKVPCSVNGTTISCSILPLTIGSLSGGTRTFRLFGDVSVASGSQNRHLQILLNAPGDLSTIGAIQWTDASGHFRWVELAQPLARGTEWK